MADFNRYWIRNGDATTAGGEVMASGTHMPVLGKSIALEGDPVQCPACNSTGVIKCVPPIRRATGHAGTQMSVDGDLCVCNCPVPPRLIASQRSHSMGFERQDIASDPAVLPWLVYAGYKPEDFGHASAPQDSTSAGSSNDLMYSKAVLASQIAHTTFPVTAQLGWDAFWRLAYQHADALIQQQANELLRRGNVTLEEARNLVEVQRNGLVAEMRKPLSPFGKFYSEALKPSSQLPTVDVLVAKKGSIEAVLASVGKSRAATNKLAFVLRRVGPAGLVLEVVAVAVVIAKADPKARRRVIAEQTSGVAGALGAGRVGMWGGAVSGAAWAGTWAAPTLAVPVVGEFTEGGAILLGGIVGGLMAGWAGQKLAQAAVDEVWDLLPIVWR